MERRSRALSLPGLGHPSAAILLYFPWWEGFSEEKTNGEAWCGSSLPARGLSRVPGTNRLWRGQCGGPRASLVPIASSWHKLRWRWWHFAWKGE